MKVVCITPIFKEVEYLEIYHTDDDFHIVEKGDSLIWICDVNFTEHVIGKYPKGHFISIAEWREKQINEILK